MRAPRRLTRRMFIADLGRGGIAVAVLGGIAAACGSDEGPASPGPATTGPPSGPPTTAPESPGAAAPTGPADLHRVDLGFVSAYVLARGGEAALVDTGVAGSASAIEAALSAAGLTWASVGHVLLTHLHQDHVGGLGDVLANAAAATPYAGEPDAGKISSPRPITVVGDGDEVFGLTVIATPGHTAGHISVLDPLAGILVAGDALNGVGGGVSGADPAFSLDMELAGESVRKLAGFDFETVVFGHGEPVEGGASAAVADLAAGT